MSEFGDITATLLEGHALTRNQYLDLPQLLAVEPILPDPITTLRQTPPKTYPKPFSAAGRPCTKTGTEHLFFSTDGEPELERREREQRALSLCGKCAVQSECLAYTLAHEMPSKTYGVAGGKTARERAKILRSRQQTQLS